MFLSKKSILFFTLGLFLSLSIQAKKEFSLDNVVIDFEQYEFGIEERELYSTAYKFLPTLRCDGYASFKLCVRAFDCTKKNKPKLIGLAIIDPQSHYFYNNNGLEFYNLCVSAEYQDKGVGRKIGKNS